MLPITTQPPPITETSPLLHQTVSEPMEPTNHPQHSHNNSQRERQNHRNSNSKTGGGGGDSEKSSGSGRKSRKKLKLKSGRKITATTSATNQSHNDYNSDSDK